MLVVGCWAFGVGCWLSVSGFNCRLMVVDCWWSVDGNCSLVVVGCWLYVGRC